MKTGHAQHYTELIPSWKYLAVAFLVVLAAICVFAVPVNAAQHISTIDVADKPAAVTITVDATSPIKLNVGKVGKQYLAIDVQGDMGRTEPRTFKIWSGGIETVKYGWFQSDPPVARIAVQSAGARTYTVDYANGKRRAVITVKKTGISASKPVASSGLKSVLVASSEIIAAAPVIEPARDVLVSLDFVGGDIHDVLKALSMQGNVNVVAGPDVKGDVTVSLSRVTINDALRMVTGLSGYNYSQVGDTYLVGTQENLKTFSMGTAQLGDDKATAVVALKYSDSEFVSKMLENQFGTVKVTSNAEKDLKGKQYVLVLAGPSEQVNAAKSMAEEIENSLAEKAESAVVDMCEVKYANIDEAQKFLASSVPGLEVSIAPNVGFNLQCASPVMMGESEGSSAAPAQTAPAKVLVLSGAGEVVEKAKALLAKIDVKRPQLVIEAKVIDLTNDASKDLGIDWSWSSMNIEEQDRSPIEKVTSFLSPISGVHLGRFNRTPVEIIAKVNALAEVGKAKMLANPQVMALDGKLASIFIGDEVKYVVSVQQTDTGINVETETATVGIQLHTVSSISSDGFITMNLHPEVSVISRWVDTPAGLALPEIARRYVDSTIRVKDGETIVIGGLIRDDEIESMSGIPILKDLPLLGGLFRSKSKSKTHSEIMMFITPRILSDN
ncbi:MAG: hypothetical protein ACYC2Y_07430 [Armatimonadota bacterium]